MINKQRKQNFKDSHAMKATPYQAELKNKEVELYPQDLLEEHGFNDGWILVDFFNAWWQDREISYKYAVSTKEKRNNNLLRDYFSLEVLTLEVVHTFLIPKLANVDSAQIRRYWPEYFPLAKSYNPVRIYLNSNSLAEAANMKRVLEGCPPIKVSKDEIFKIADRLFLGVSKEMILLNHFLLDGKYEDNNSFAREYKKAYKNLPPLKATEEFVVREFLSKLKKYKADTITLALDLAKSREYSSKSKLGFKSVLESIKTAELVLNSSR